MQFQFNSDNQVDGDTQLAGKIEEIIRSRLSRATDRLTRVEVHVGDVNGPRGGAEKRCAIEIRPMGMQPILATNAGDSVETAAAGAADKVLSALDRQIGKRTDRKGH